MTAPKNATWTNVRWATDRLADGRCRAFAWQSAAEGTPPAFAETTAATELAALDALRVSLLQAIRRPPDWSIENDRGERIDVGGGYR